VRTASARGTMTGKIGKTPGKTRATMHRDNQQGRARGQALGTMVTLHHKPCSYWRW
jgi:hypothetical protein